MIFRLRATILSRETRFHHFSKKEILPMAEVNQSIMEKAEARFMEKQKKTAERNQATAEYVSEAKARDIKTARLRALRLAKEEADRAAEALNPVAPKKKRASRAAKKADVASTEVKS
ncbi:hypothetical protein [Mesorhizobium sp.]|uniref:hypothetical protein n=2 Tax=Mesorhizobium sp. TaxID=1871066 RepID=UPI0025BCB97E|nr:hypothetical protein [Mesorhizobium sp.]